MKEFSLKGLYSRASQKIRIISWIFFEEVFYLLDKYKKITLYCRIYCTLTIDVSLWSVLDSLDSIADL